MTIEYKIEADKVNVTLKGELDTPTTVEIQSDIDKILEQADKLITIDCSQLEYIASSGLRQLIAIYKRCSAEGGHLKLVSVTPEVMEIFAITNFDKVFDFA